MLIILKGLMMIAMCENLAMPADRKCKLFSTKDVSHRMALALIPSKAELLRTLIVFQKYLDNEKE